MTAADLVVVDTNVLLSASDRSRTTHEAALRLLRDDPRDLHVTPQVVGEYLAVATREVEANGLGLPHALAVENVRDLRTSLGLLAEGAGSTERLLGLVGSATATGRQVHDANIVAVALTHGASTIVTDDARHFARFAEHLTIEPLG